MNPHHGLAIGEGDYDESYSLGKIGAEIHAKPGESVHVSWIVDLGKETVRNAKGNREIPGSGDWTGTLKTGVVKFSVVAPDPNAKPDPGIATEPGRYKIAPGVKL